MGLSFVKHTYAGGAQTFAVSFALDFLSREDVTAYVEGELAGDGSIIYRDFTWVNDSQITIDDPLTVDDVVVIERTVSKTDLVVDFTQEGSATRQNIQFGLAQAMMAMHEFIDGRITDLDLIYPFSEFIETAQELYASTVVLATEIADDETLVAANKAAAELAQAAAEAAEAAAALSETAAGDSETAAAASEVAALASQVAAAASAAAAAASETAAGDSETAAAASEAAAAASAAAAAASATEAATFDPDMYYTKTEADALLPGSATDTVEGLVEKASAAEITAATGDTVPTVTQVASLINDNAPQPTFTALESMGTGATKSFTVDTVGKTKVTLFVKELSHNAGGGSQLAMRLGGAGGVVSTGYKGSGLGTSVWDAYAYIIPNDGGSARYAGRIVLERMEASSDEWAITSELMRADTGIGDSRVSAGNVDVGEDLTSVTFYCITGSTFFDNGFVSIKVE